MTIKSTDCIGLDKKVEAERAKLTTLYYKGKWVLRTSETGIEINGKVAWYRIVWAYTQYIWISIIKWFGDGPGPTDNNV